MMSAMDSLKEAGLFCCWLDRLSLAHLTKYELMSAVGSLKEAGLFCCWLDRLPSVLLALKSR